MLPEHIAMLVILITGSFTGIPLNIFIIAVSARAWVKGGYQSPADLILLALGISNVTMQILQFFINMTYFFWKDFLVSQVYILCHAINSSTILSCSWMTAWLCTFYCLKIVTFRYQLLTFLKLRFLKLLPWLILGTVGLSSSLMAFLAGNIFKDNPLNNTVNSTLYNNSLEYVSVQVSFKVFIYAMEVGFSIPFFLILVSLGLTLTSLSLHVLRMLQSSSNFTSSQLKFHMNAAKTMTLLLVLHITFYLSHLSLKIFPHFTPWSWFCIVIYIYFCTLQALILISGNRKLSLACGIYSCSYTCPQAHE
ncbi:hypothetical protein FKM82_029043 [Ascaphus truei]